MFFICNINSLKFVLLVDKLRSPEKLTAFNVYNHKRRITKELHDIRFLNFIYLSTVTIYANSSLPVNLVDFAV